MKTIRLGFAGLGLVSVLAIAGLAQPPACGDKDYDCQIRGFQAQLKADPGNIEMYYSLGVAYQNKGDDSQAIAMYDRYLSGGVTNPQYLADAYYERAFLRAKLGDPELAINDYTQAIKHVPTNAQFYIERGDTFAKLKNYDPAIADYTKALTLKPDVSAVYESRGYAYMEKKSYPLAIADFTKAMTLDPERAEAYYNRGTIYYRQKLYAKAIVDMNKYIEMGKAEPEYLADGYLNRGLSQFFLGFTVKAIADFTKAIELAPEKKKVYVARANAYRKLKKLALAIADEKKAATLEDEPEDQ